MKKKILGFILCLVFCLGIAVGEKEAYTKAAENTQETVTPSPEPTKEPESPVDSQLSMSQTFLNTTVGQQTKLTINGLEGLTNYQQNWSSEDPTKATVNENGEVTAIAPTTDTGVKIFNQVTVGARVYYFECTVYISQPVLSENTIYLQVGKTKKMNIQGLLTLSMITYETSDPGIALVMDDGTITAFTAGQCTVTAIVDGLRMECRVIVTNAKLNCTWFLSRVGKTKQLSVTGSSGTTPITYKSANKKIATVSAKGKIKAKKRGNTKIIVSVDGMQLTCVVNITYKKALNVINKGKKKLGYTYSQPRRMWAKYFDCSSFVWRMYKTQKIYFGSRWVAPVAASEAKYLVGKKKVVAYKYVNESKLLAGDLIFVKGKYNGRYRNICHVAIYIGNGKILHATPPHVKYGTYDMYRSRITLIARPCK